MLIVKNVDYWGNISFVIVWIWCKWFFLSIMKEIKWDIEIDLVFFNLEILFLLIFMILII